MIRQKFSLRDYGHWVVDVYYSIDRYNVEEIMKNLIRIGCEDEFLRKAYKNLSSGNLNTGLTYSNPRTHRSVMVIARTSNGAEFQDSYDHERMHLIRQISECLGILTHGEDEAYLTGEIGYKMYPVSKFLMCDCCRSKIREVFDVS